MTLFLVFNVLFTFSVLPSIRFLNCIIMASSIGQWWLFSGSLTHYIKFECSDSMCVWGVCGVCVCVFVGVSM
jgi:hypothetical protein